MSIAVMTEVWKHARHEGGTLLVLLAMADVADDDGGRIFQRIEKLAAKARLSKRATQNALRRLEADGVISVVANVAPALMSQMVKSALSGDYDGARTLHYRLLPLMRALFVETNPIPVKAALEILGHQQAHFRLPLVRPTAEVEAFLRRALTDAGLMAEEGAK